MFECIFICDNIVVFIDRLMYWSDWGTEPAIMRSGMDGSNIIKFIKDDIHWPNGLAIDHGTNYLYWVDAKEARIECVKLDGTDRRVSKFYNLKEFSFYNICIKLSQFILLIYLHT